jgi:translation initiation factor 2 alpha subunit (eIF-2alpha)
LYEDNTSEISTKLYKDILTTNDIFFEHIKTIYPIQTQIFKENMKSRLITGTMEMSKTFRLRLFDYNAVKKIIDMLSYKDESTEILYCSSPKYRIVTTGKTEDECKLNIQKCIEYLKIEKNKYNCYLETLENEEESSEFSYKINKPIDVTLKPLNISGF